MCSWCVESAGFKFEAQAKICWQMFGFWHVVRGCPHRVQGSRLQSPQGSRSGARQWHVLFSYSGHVDQQVDPRQGDCTDLQSWDAACAFAIRAGITAWTPNPGKLAEEHFGPVTWSPFMRPRQCPLDPSQEFERRSTWKDCYAMAPGFCAHEPWSRLVIKGMMCG